MKIFNTIVLIFALVSAVSIIYFSETYEKSSEELGEKFCKSKGYEWRKGYTFLGECFEIRGDTIYIRKLDKHNGKVYFKEDK